MTQIFLSQWDEIGVEMVAEDEEEDIFYRQTCENDPLDMPIAPLNIYEN